jgi:hypothetical protein
MRRILTVAEFRELCLKEPYPYVGLITHDLAVREQNEELMETLELLVTALEDQNPQPQMSMSVRVNMSNARKAIAKVRGESVKA